MSDFDIQDILDRVIVRLVYLVMARHVLQYIRAGGIVLEE